MTDDQLLEAVQRGIAAGTFIEVTHELLAKWESGLDHEPWEDIDL